MRAQYQLNAAGARLLKQFSTGHCRVAFNWQTQPRFSSGQKPDADACVSEQFGKSLIVLARKHFGGRHAGNLFLIAIRNPRRDRGHHGFSRSHVSLQQTIHRFGPAKVRGDFFNTPLLRRGKRKRKFVHK